MKKAKVQVRKQSEGHWMVWTLIEGVCKCADIHAIVEHGFLKAPKRFRVDFEGKTVGSMICHFQTAKGIASKHVSA